MWPAENIMQSMWPAVLSRFPTPDLDGPAFSTPKLICFFEWLPLRILIHKTTGKQRKLLFCVRAEAIGKLGSYPGPRTLGGILTLEV